MHIRLARFNKIRCAAMQIKLVNVFSRTYSAPSGSAKMLVKSTDELTVPDVCCVSYMVGMVYRFADTVIRNDVERARV